jgi:hypothetical protein
MTIFRCAGSAIALVFLLLPSAPAWATQYWELSPANDPTIAMGTYMMVGGKTSPDGVNFTLKNNSADQPVALTLIATTQGAPLHLSAFKDDGQSFLDKDTDATGLLTIKFRTADTMNFKVTGAAGSAYQLSLWRGPAIALPPPDPVVAMDTVTGHAESTGAPPPATTASGAATGPVSQSATGAATPPVSPAASGSNPLIYILLGGIMVALIVIALLIYRGQQRRGNP